VPRAFVLAGLVVAVATVTAAWPSGPITRADTETERKTVVGTDNDNTCHDNTCPTP